MAFSDVTAELEELINKCEFENRQYVRAINQENQLATSTEQEASLKKNEIERLQVEMAQIDQQTKHYDKHFKHNKENIDSLKKTSDVLTDHIHAMKTKFDNLKLKRDEEKGNHDQQLQHFRDVWTRYKEKYESFPLAIQLQKLQSQIQETEESTCKKQTEIQTLKESIKEVESANYWRKMDWKEFVIRLAEKRLQALRLNEQIMKTKQETETLNVQKALEVEMQAHDENNVVKMSEMQINEDEKDKNTNMTAMEICSPLISVLSERDDEDGEFMQTDQYPEIERKTEMQITENTYTEADMSSTRKEDQQDFFMSIQQGGQQKGDKGPNKDLLLQESKPHPPYVHYQKSSDYGGTVKENVDLHLNTKGDKSFIEIPNSTYTKQTPQVNHKYPQLANSVSTVRDTSFITTKSQENLGIQKPQLSNVPGKISPSSTRQASRSIFEMKAPTVSQSVDRVVDRSMPQRSYTRPSLISTIHSHPPKITSSTHTAKNIMMPKISYNIPSSMKATTRTTRSVPKLDSQQYARSPVSPMPRQQDFKQPGLSTNDLRTTDNTRAKPTNPEMLKVQTSRILKSFTPQPSPCPTASTQHAPQQKEAAKQIRPELCFPLPVDQTPAAKIPEEISPTKKSSLLPPGNIYYEPLKSSPQKKTARKSQSAHRSPTGKGKESGNNSPFNMERHRQRLEELKRSPGYEQFQAESSSEKNQLMFGGGDNNIIQSPGKQSINTAVFGGAKQPAGDNFYTASPLVSSATEGAFSLFSLNDSPGVGDSGATFMMFGSEDNDKDKGGASDNFRFNFGRKDTAKSPQNALSLFDSTAEGKSPKFCFDFKKEDSLGSSEGDNILSLFGGSSVDHDDEMSSTGCTFNFGNKNAGDSGMFSLFGSSENESKEESTFSFKFS